MRRLVSILVALLLATTAACSDSDASSSDGNLFANPGFEAGADPWITLVNETGFEVTTEQANSGEHSAVLRMDDPASAEGNMVYYLVQEIEPDDLPERVEGFFRVENWQRGAQRQYVQFVVAAIAPDNFPEIPDNVQLRYILAGAQEPPFDIANAHFVFVGGAEPVEGEWVPFSLDIRDDFTTYWGKAPQGFEKLRLFFEVRWDGKRAGSGAPRADVYYDDLYIGSGSTE
jgi:hypothetical protein